MCSRRRSSRSSRPPWPRIPVSTPMSTTSTPVCRPGAIGTRRSATLAGSTRAMRMATVSARSTSTRWRGRGPCYAPGCGHTGASRRRSCRCISASSSSCTTPGAGAKLSWAPSSRLWSCDVPPSPPRNPIRASPVYETFVRLSRGGVTATIPMERLVSNPAENIYAQPGDVLTLVRLPQSFTAFGATGTNALIPFTAERMTLGEALAKAGGLQDQRSDPAGVFLFRYEPPPIVKALGRPVLATGPDEATPVIYRLDLRNAKSFFLAQRFPIEDKDIIYVANAELNELQKFFTLVNTLTGPVISGFVVTNAVQ